MKKIAAIIVIIIIIAVGIGIYVAKSNNAPAAPAGEQPATQDQAFSLPSSTSTSDDINSLQNDANATDLNGIDAGMSASVDSEFSK